jgi:hypothetical protein
MRDISYLRTGFTKAPFPAMSHTAILAQVQFFASAFHSKVADPNGRVWSSGNVCVCVSRPSPQTISPNASGNVHCAFTVAFTAFASAVEIFVWDRQRAPLAGRLECESAGPCFRPVVRVSAAAALVLRVRPFSLPHGIEICKPSHVGTRIIPKKNL